MCLENDIFSMSSQYLYFENVKFSTNLTGDALRCITMKIATIGIKASYFLRICVDSESTQCRFRIWPALAVNQASIKINPGQILNPRTTYYNIIAVMKRHN